MLRRRHRVTVSFMSAGRQRNALPCSGSSVIAHQTATAGLQEPRRHAQPRRQTSAKATTAQRGCSTTCCEITLRTPVVRRTRFAASFAPGDPKAALRAVPASCSATRQEGRSGCRPQAMNLRHFAPLSTASPTRSHHQCVHRAAASALLGRTQKRESCEGSGSAGLTRGERATLVNAGRPSCV